MSVQKEQQPNKQTRIRIENKMPNNWKFIKATVAIAAVIKCNIQL